MILSTLRGPPDPKFIKLCIRKGPETLIQETSVHIAKLIHRLVIASSACAMLAGVSHVEPC